MYLSRVLFGETTTIKIALQDSKSHWLRLLGTYLSLSRFSPSRSMTASVVFLEHQKGAARSARVAILSNEVTRAYTLMLALLHIEGVGVYALTGFISSIYPDLIDLNYWADIFAGREAQPSLAYVLISVLGPVVLAGAIAPLYVSAGFLLYINRRMRLEAWDIEHQFEDLKAHHSPHNLASALLPTTMVSALLLAGALSIAPINSVRADTSTNENLSVNSVRNSVDNILESKDFGYSEVVTKRRLKPKDGDDKDEEDFDFDESTVEKILNNFQNISRLLIYLIAGVAIALLLWGVFKFMPESWQLARRRPALDLLDVEHHPLTRSLPDDIASAAREALTAGNQREAVSLLYRGALRTVMRRHKLEIPRSATEGECRTHVLHCKQEEQSKHFSRVVNEWTAIAYASEQPSVDSTQALINYWVNAFSNDAATTATPAANDSIAPAGTSS